MGVIAGHCALRAIRNTARCPARVTVRRARHRVPRTSRFTAQRKGARVTARCSAARVNACRARRVEMRAARGARRTAARRTTHAKGGVHTVDRWTRKRHHSLHDWVLGRNNWSPRRIPRRRVYVEQIFLDVVHHGVTAFLEKRHDELPCSLAMLLCCLVLRLLHLLQYIKVAFQSCILLVSVLFGRGYSPRRNTTTILCTMGLISPRCTELAHQIPSRHTILLTDRL